MTNFNLYKFMHNNQTKQEVKKNFGDFRILLCLSFYIQNFVYLLVMLIISGLSLFVSVYLCI